MFKFPFLNPRLKLLFQKTGPFQFVHLCPASSGYSGECNGYANHTSTVKDVCDGQRECLFHGTNSVAGDPCHGIQKYTVIDYYCILGKTIHLITSYRTQSYRETYPVVNDFCQKVTIFFRQNCFFSFFNLTT